MTAPMKEPPFKFPGSAPAYVYFKNSVSQVSGSCLLSLLVQLENVVALSMKIDGTSQMLIVSIKLFSFF